MLQFLADPAAHLAVNPLDASSLLAAFGALGIAVVLFAETGLLVGFFLPGDSLLFTAGLLCVPGATRGPQLGSTRCCPPPWSARWQAPRSAT